MDELLPCLKSQLEEQSVTLRELKHENEALRKVLGFGLSASAGRSEPGSYMETKTLREVVEQIQLDVKEIMETIPSGNSTKKRSSLLTVSSSERDACTCSITKEPPGEYVPKKIRSMTAEDEQEWVKARFNEFKLHHETSKNNGTNVSKESIPNIFSTLQKRSFVTSCGVKLTNHSRSTLSSPLYFVPPGGGDKCRLPSCIDVGKSEAICFQGIRETCDFLFSFDIGTSLRLIIFGLVLTPDQRNRFCQLGIGFSPTNLPMDKPLYDVLTADSFLPNGSVKSNFTQTPTEIFSSQGNYFVRGHMTPGRLSVVNVDILESNIQFRIPSIFSPVKATSLNSSVTLDYLQRVSNLAGTSDDVTCLMELANGLDVSIKFRGCRSCERSRMCAEVLPLDFEMFFATGKVSIEAAFAYEIESTDVGLLVAVKAQKGKNKFAAVFLPVSEIMFDADLDKLLDQDTWGYLLTQKFAYAKDGEQMVQTRNIRANVTMTEDQKSQVKILLYTV